MVNGDDKLDKNQLKELIELRKKVSKLIKKEKVLLQNEERLTALIENTSDWIWEIDLDLNYKYVSPNVKYQSGFESDEILGKPIYILRHPDEVEIFKKDFQKFLKSKKKHYVIENTILHKDGNSVILETSIIPVFNGDGEIIGYRGIDRDITSRKKEEEEKKQIESQLQQSQKMDAIATLAGGIAHQFNNSLSVILGNIDLMEDEYSEDRILINYTENIKASIERMSKLANQLHAYARGGKYQEKIISGSDFMRDSLPLIMHTIKSDIILETVIPRNINSIKVDTTQLQMVLAAILTNASESIKGKGRISVVCKNEVIHKESTYCYSDLKPGNYVKIIVKDEGQGMDKETKERVFDPFFTTKFTGRGLGMAAVYGIIKNHNGEIYIDSVLNKGTSINIFLPAFNIQKNDLNKQKIDFEEIKNDSTILIIEDEESVLDMLKKLVEKIGYRVLSAKNGKEAIDLVKHFEGQIDLALLDIILPDIDGKEIFKTIKKIRPQLKVIVCSGYEFNGTAKEILEQGADNFIQKPFKKAEFSKIIRTVLYD